MTMTTRPLTGRTVLIIVLLFFGTVFTVNMSMAWMAVKSFPGLEVENTYVASQNFDSETAANARLGWQVESFYKDGMLSLIILDRVGDPVTVAFMDASIGRATHANDDVTLEFAQSQSPYFQRLQLAGGKWELRLKVTATDGTVFRQRHKIFVTP
jgi:nitrogen fixation protein FixH